ncbi:MAG TPA: NAD(P)H-dependent oxidoreductase subunit E, partial [Actinomycetota bacterium]
MDLHLTAASPTDEEREAVDALLGPPLPSSGDGDARVAYLDGRVVRGGREARERRTLLLPALHALQSRVGWISEGGLNYVSSRLTVAPAEAYGVATFYAMFSVEPRPPVALHVCDDLACRLAGSERLASHLEGAVGPERATDAAATATWMRSPCLGMCELAPAVLVQAAGDGAADVAFGDAT